MIIMVHLARLQYEEIFIDLNIISRKTRLVSEMSLRCEPERMIDASAHKIVDGTLDRRKNWTLFVDDFSYFGPISGCLQLYPVKWFCSRTHKSQSIKPSKSTDLSERRQLSSRTQPSKWAIVFPCEGSFYHFSFPPVFLLILHSNLQICALFKSCHSTPLPVFVCKALCLYLSLLSTPHEIIPSCHPPPSQNWNLQTFCSFLNHSLVRFRFSWETWPVKSQLPNNQ